MTKYRCERCCYETPLKGNLKRHLENVVSCEALYSAISPNELLEELMKSKTYKCSHCEKSFSYSQNRVRHERMEHPEIFVNTANSNNHTENHNQSHNNTTTTTTNTTNSHNTTMSNCHNTVINLNVFGKEELSHILEDEEFLTHCVRNITGKGLQNIVNSIWCNKNVPENHNVELKRERKPRLVNVFVDDDKGKRWVEKLADEVIDDMIRKGTGILQVQNNKLYKYDGEMTESDTERHDIRSNAISKIMSKSRGYAKKRDSIVVELRNMKKEGLID
jgi:hypothetical protein